MFHSVEKFRRGSLYCCNKLGYRKNLNKRWGVSRFSVGNFLSNSPEKNRRGILYCCNIFGCQKSLDTRGGGEHQAFPSEIFCLTVPKNFVGEHFSVSLVAGTDKVWISEGGGYQDFPSKFFLSYSAENLSTVESFSIWLISGIEKFYASEGYVTIF